MDFFALLVLLVLCAFVVALLSGNSSAWTREEWRRIQADTWAPPTANTMDDPRVQRTFVRLREARRRMKREGVKLLIEDRPGWRRINPMGEAAPPRRVVSMRSRAK